MIDEGTSKRRALLFLMLAAPAPSIGAAFAFHLAPGLVGNVVYALGKGVLYGMPLLWWWLVRAGRSTFPTPTAHGWRTGLTSGLALGGLILAAWYLVGRGSLDPAPLRERAAASGFDTQARYLLMAAGLVFANALLEEYAFRWFLYGRCRELVAPVGAAVLGALIFTAHHVIVLRAFFDWPVVVAGSAAVFAAGLVWTWLYERKGSVWPGYLSHMLADVALLWIGWELLF